MRQLEISSASFWCLHPICALLKFCSHLILRGFTSFATDNAFAFVYREVLGPTNGTGPSSSCHPHKRKGSSAGECSLITLTNFKLVVPYLPCKDLASVVASIFLPLSVLWETCKLEEAETKCVGEVHKSPRPLALSEGSFPIMCLNLFLSYFTTPGLWENFLDDYHGKLCWGVPYMPNASGLYISTLMKLVCNSCNCLKPECQQSMKCKVHPVWASFMDWNWTLTYLTC